MLTPSFDVKLTIKNRPNYVSVTGLFPYSVGPDRQSRCQLLGPYKIVNLNLKKIRLTQCHFVTHK